MKLDKKKILEYQQNRDPYLMVDYVTNVNPGKSAEGYKILKPDEWFFKVHWPKDPNMPGMLQIESLVQMSSFANVTLPGNKGKILYLTSANKIKFLKKIIPNDKLILKTEILKFQRGLAICKGEGYIESKLACSAEFSLILPDEIKKYKIVK